MCDHSFCLVWFGFQSRSDLHFFAIPILLVCVFAYFVAHCFLSVYEVRKWCRCVNSLSVLVPNMHTHAHMHAHAHTHTHTHYSF